MNQEHKIFQLRLRVEYGDETDIFVVEKHLPEENRWHVIGINEKTPGLLVFLYSILTCQHLFLRNPAQKAGLGLLHTTGELRARFNKKTFRFETIQTSFQVKSRTEPSCQLADEIARRMENCPVSNNLDPAIDKTLSLSFTSA